MKNKRIIYRISNGIITIAVVAILVILNIFVKDASWQVDLTETGMYKLTPQTIDYIKNLDKETKLILLQREDTPDDYLVKIVKLYPKHSSKIKIEKLDPDQNPAKLEKYLKRDSKLTYGSVVVDNGEEWDVVNKYGTLIRDAEGNIVSKVERKITSAIYKINTSQKNTVYLLTGHGERGTQELYQIKDYLSDILYDLKEINLIAEGKIPEDIYSLAILGPTGDINDEEKDMILEYMKNGGKLTLAIDVDVKEDNYKNIKEIVKEYNLTLDDNYICEDKGHYAQDLVMALIPMLSPNEITRDTINSKVNIFMPLSRSISVINKKNKDVTIKPILVTSEGSWAETDFANAPKKEDSDRVGPFYVAVAATKVQDEIESKLVVFGSSNLIESQVIDRYATLGNKDLFITTIKWFNDDNLNNLDVPEKVEKEEHYSIDGKTAQKLIIGSLIVPLVFLALGVCTYIRRRD